MPDHPLNSPALPRLWALIPCAGSGSRAGSAGPKQYQALAGQPLVMHTLAAFAGVTRLHRVALILAAGDTALNYLSDQYLIANNGGATRAETVFNGLNFLLEQGADAQDWVLVHDAARCLVTSWWCLTAMWKRCERPLTKPLRRYFWSRFRARAALLCHHLGT